MFDQATADDSCCFIHYDSQYNAYMHVKVKLCHCLKLDSIIFKLHFHLVYIVYISLTK